MGTGYTAIYTFIRNVLITIRAQNYRYEHIFQEEKRSRAFLDQRLVFSAVAVGAALWPRPIGAAG